jgi:uncharacterized protein (DUF1501 family)
MLEIHTGAARLDCSGRSRRDFLSAGTLALGGLTLPALLAARAHARSRGLDYVRDRSVVLLFLSGGPSHIETFDPHLEAPLPYRSLTGGVPTSVPGIWFGGTFPRLARLAHRMAVVRSFQHAIGDHERAIAHVLSGGTDPRGDARTGFGMGALCARLKGASHPLTGVPTHTLLVSDEVDGQYRNERGRVTKASQPGTLGASCAPFIPGDKGPAVENLRLRVPIERLQDRRALLEKLDRLKRLAGGDAAFTALDEHTAQAFEVLLGDALSAFDLSREDPRVRERYDTSHVQVGHKQFRPSDLGSLLLMARRLCEAGCGFVTVHSAGWDMHADVNNPGIVKGMGMLGSALDRAASAFLEDVEARGLSDRILFVITGDFGRTPKVNEHGGRDHWSNLSTLAFAGGGLRLGGAVGRSRPRADEPATEPVTPHQLLGTLVHSLFDAGRLRLDTAVPREVQDLATGAPPIAELF